MTSLFYLVLILFSNNYLFAGKEDKIYVVTANAKTLAGFSVINKIDIATTPNDRITFPVTNNTTISTIDIDDFKNAVVNEYKKNQSFLEKNSNTIALGLE